MSLLTKSNQNIQAAEKLKSEGNYHDASIQCAYYACLQLAQHLLNQAKIELDYKEASSHQKITEALRD